MTDTQTAIATLVSKVVDGEAMITSPPLIIPETPKIPAQPTFFEETPKKEPQEKVLFIEIPDHPLIKAIMDNPTPAVLQRLIGQIYTQGIQPNKDETIKWLTRSAEGGDREAQYLLAENIKDKDETKWRHWLHTSAKNGYAEAQYGYAFCVDSDSEEEDDMDQLKLITLAAEQGHNLAICQLMQKYVNEKDLENVLKWANIYFEKVNIADRYVWVYHVLATLYHKESKQDGFLIVEDEKKVFDYLTTAIELLEKNRNKYKHKDLSDYDDEFVNEYHHDYTIYSFLGDMYFNGWGTDVNYEKAYDLYVVAGINNEADGLYMLYTMHNEGIGVKRNESLAYDYLVRSADRGCNEGRYYLALSKLQDKDVQNYQKGKPCDKIHAEKLIQQAIHLLNEASVFRKDTKCTILLGVVQWKYNKNYKLSFEMWKKATEMSDPTSDVYYYLGKMYREGIHVQKNYEEAVKYFHLFIINDKADIEIYFDGDHSNVLKNFQYPLEEVKQNYASAVKCFEILINYDNIIAQYIYSWLCWNGLGIEKDEKKAYKWYSTALVSDKNDELKDIRQELKAYENEILVKTMSKIDEKKDENVEQLKAKLEESQKQIQLLMDQVEKLSSAVVQIRDAKQSETEMIIIEKTPEKVINVTVKN